MPKKKEKIIEQDTTNIAESESLDMVDSGEALSAESAESADVNQDDAQNTDNTQDKGEHAIIDNRYTVNISLEYHNIEKIIDVIAEHFKKSDDLQIDVSKIDEISTAAVQAFICVNRYAKSNHKNLEWVSPSNAFINSFNTLGLYSEMMKMEMK